MQIVDVNDLGNHSSDGHAIILNQYKYKSWRMF